MTRPDSLVRAFVDLADTLVDDFDVVEFLNRLCRESLEVVGGTAAGVMLTSEDDNLGVVAASDERMRAIELLEIQMTEGPCLEAFKTQAPVLEITEETLGRWPAFAPRALDEGFRVVCAFPLRLRSQTLGALNLFREQDVLPTEWEATVGQALADVATIGLLQERAIQGSTLLAEQLQHALQSRIAVEQAKGILAERHGIELDAAFELLRKEARGNNRRLAEVAGDVIGRQAANM